MPAAIYLDDDRVTGKLAKRPRISRCAVFCTLFSGFAVFFLVRSSLTCT
jgi:hypothetical protein